MGILKLSSTTTWPSECWKWLSEVVKWSVQTAIKSIQTLSSAALGSVLKLSAKFWNPNMAGNRQAIASYHFSNAKNLAQKAWKWIITTAKWTAKTLKWAGKTVINTAGHAVDWLI